MPRAEPAHPRFEDPAAFEAWASTQSGKWELHDGVPVAISPERSVHARLKAQCWLAFRTALRGKRLPCEAFVDGMLVPGPGARRFQPDVVVACGDEVAPDDYVVEHPLILVEVLSPSTQVVDTDLKLESYFALPSVQHYILLSTRKRLMVVYSRLAGARLLTALHAAGPVELDPPGMSITVEEVYEDVRFG